MLARANRVVRAADFREVVRRGRRSSSPNAVYYRLSRDPDAPLRFGFIVSRAVGNAVQRNLVRRRLRSLARDIVDSGGRGHDVVVRALPACASLSWSALEADVHRALESLAVTQ